MPNIVKFTKVTNDTTRKAINRPCKVMQPTSSRCHEWLRLGCSQHHQASTEGRKPSSCVTFKENDRTKFESFYIVTTSRMNGLTSIVPNKSVKQSGIADEDIVMVRNYKFSNIVAADRPQIEEHAERETPFSCTWRTLLSTNDYLLTKN